MKQSPFRSIRMKLFSEGKSVRYLGYAVGKIALIIIGIMFALQLNNWNEDRKSQAEFEVYVVQLKEDVRKGIKNVKDSIATMEGFLERSEFVLTFLELSDYEPDDLAAFESGLNFLSIYNRPQVYVGLLGQILNGNMDVIGRNQPLANHALEMESWVESRLSNQENISGQIDIGSNRFNKFRGRGTSGSRSTLIGKGRAVVYDLNEMKSSAEFEYTLITINSRKINMMLFSEQIAEALEDFLAVLEKYE